MFVNKVTLLAMLLIPLLQVMAATMTEEAVPFQPTLMEKRTPREVFPIDGQDDLASYCRELVQVKLSTHRPRSTRATSQYRSFSAQELEEFTDEQWKAMLGEKHKFLCSASEFIPRRRDTLKQYAAMSCHHLCRACFSDSLPVCLRRNLDNNFGSTCYCSYDQQDPIVNHSFRIHD